MRRGERRPPHACRSGVPGRPRATTSPCPLRHLHAPGGHHVRACDASLCGDAMRCPGWLCRGPGMPGRRRARASLWRPVVDVSALDGSGPLTSWRRTWSERRQWFLMAPGRYRETMCACSCRLGRWKTRGEGDGNVFSRSRDALVSPCRDSGLVSGKFGFVHVMCNNHCVIFSLFKNYRERERERER